MWTYYARTGELCNQTDGHMGWGYSGCGFGLNNPDFQQVADTGPIPDGFWIIGPFVDDPEKGPVVSHLVPRAGTETFGRTGFMIHGDNAAMNYTASKGCIILPRKLREAIRDSGDTELEVV